MSDNCQCPKCGRIHRDLGFGRPPEAISRAAALMLFYGVPNIDDLIAAQDHHIKRLQDQLPKPAQPFFPQRVR